MKETIPTLILCTAALQSDPGLVATNKRLLKQKQSLDVKVDAALAKADPALAPFIKKLQNATGDRSQCRENSIARPPSGPCPEKPNHPQSTS